MTKKRLLNAKLNGKKPKLTEEELIDLHRKLIPHLHNRLVKQLYRELLPSG